MKNLVFYISGHGFGHASRSCRVVEAVHHLLDQSRVAHRIMIRSGAPEWYFRGCLGFDFDYSRTLLDVGVVQSNSLCLDPGRTLNMYADLIEHKDEMLEAEIRALDAFGPVSLVFGDIPPFAFAVAAKMGVRSVAMGNFSWDWIYEPFVEQAPEYGFILDDIRADYRLAGLLLELPFGDGMDHFAHVCRVPLVCRPAGNEKKFTRKLCGIEEGKTVVLLSFGGIGLDGDFFESLQHHPECVFICSENAAFNDRTVLNFSRDFLLSNNLSYQDLVKASDVVVTKPGYGILSECIANDVPMIYTDRGNFREYPVLVEGIKKYLPASLFMSNEDLKNGLFAEFAGFVAAKHRSTGGCRFDRGLDGHTQCAMRIVARLV